MSFSIQVSNPTATTEADEHDETIGETVESLFPLDTEHAFVVWNGIYIPLSYKYDLSVIYDDVIEMIETLVESSEGDLTVCWPSSSFDAEWNLKWADGSVEIKAEWRRLLGSTERLLRDSGPVVIEIGRFVAEWRSLLMRLYEALDQAGVSQRLTDGMARLRSLITRMNSQVLQ